MVGLFRGRRKVWISLAIALVLVGALFVALSVPGMTSRVAAHVRVGGTSRIDFTNLRLQ